MTCTKKKKKIILKQAVKKKKLFLIKSFKNIFVKIFFEVKKLSIILWFLYYTNNDKITYLIIQNELCIISIGYYLFDIDNGNQIVFYTKENI